MRVVFFGTPEWAVPSLDTLLPSDIDVVAVVTNPDRPAGRGLEAQPSPVKRRAVAAASRFSSRGGRATPSCSRSCEASPRTSLRSSRTAASYR